LKWKTTVSIIEIFLFRKVKWGVLCHRGSVLIQDLVNVLFRLWFVHKYYDFVMFKFFWLLFSSSNVTILIIRKYELMLWLFNLIVTITLLYNQIKWTCQQTATKISSYTFKIPIFTKQHDRKKIFFSIKCNLKLVFIHFHFYSCKRFCPLCIIIRSISHQITQFFPIHSIVPLINGQTFHSLFLSLIFQKFFYVVSRVLMMHGKLLAIFHGKGTLVENNIYNKISANNEATIYLFLRESTSIKMVSFILFYFSTCVYHIIYKIL